MFILGEDDRKPWGKWDILLAEAYHILMSERCPQCGLPRYVCQNEDNDIQFRIEPEKCNAMVAEEQYKNPSRGRDKKPREIPAGTVLRPIPYSVSGRDLADYREPYYRSLARMREAAGGSTEGD